MRGYTSGMKRTIAFALVLIAAAAMASEKWPLEPNDFRGLQFPGALKADVAKKLSPSRGTCQPKPSACLDQWGFSLGGVTLTTLYQFKDDKLVLVYLSFPAESFDKIKEIFVERYGPPTATEKKPVRTKMGVEYENEVTLWVGDIVDIQFNRFGSTVNDSTVYLLDKAWKAEQDKAEQDAKKKAATSF
jgi:hypothetical protein